MENIILYIVLVFVGVLLGLFYVYIAFRAARRKRIKSFRVVIKAGNKSYYDISSDEILLIIGDEGGYKHSIKSDEQIDIMFMPYKEE